MNSTTLNCLCVDVMPTLCCFSLVRMVDPVSLYLVATELKIQKLVFKNFKSVNFVCRKDLKTLLLTKENCLKLFIFLAGNVSVRL